MRILVHIEGGLVQSVSSDVLQDVEVVVVDYDTEGCDADEIYSIPQSDDPSDTSEAFIVWHGPLDKTADHLTRYLDSLEDQ